MTRAPRRKTGPHLTPGPKRKLSNPTALVANVEQEQKAFVARLGGGDISKGTRLALAFAMEHMQGEGVADGNHE